MKEMIANTIISFCIGYLVRYRYDRKIFIRMLAQIEIIVQSLRNLNILDLEGYNRIMRSIHNKKKRL